MQLFAVVWGPSLSTSIIPVGQTSAQRPHLVHFSLSTESNVIIKSSVLRIYFQIK